MIRSYLSVMNVVLSANAYSRNGVQTCPRLRIGWVIGWYIFFESYTIEPIFATSFYLQRKSLQDKSLYGIFTKKTSIFKELISYLLKYFTRKKIKQFNCTLDNSKVLLNYEFSKHQAILDHPSTIYL